MKYASSVLAANGSAALALLAALMDHMHHTGALIPKDREAILAAAAKLLPQGAERINVEAREIIEAMKNA